MGSGEQGIFWHDLFCIKLSELDLYVIRFDYRDTGVSTHVDFEKEPYDFLTIVNDVLGLLDICSIKEAHFVGLSMGGFISQLTAIHYPQNVLSVTSMMSTSNYSILLDALCDKPISNLTLSPPKKEFMNAIAQIDPTLALSEKLLINWKEMNGPRASFDEKFWSHLIKRSLTREKCFGGKDGIHNHRRAALRTSEVNLIPLLGQVTIPFLIIQGSDDPVFPVDHGNATKNAVLDGELLLIQKMGHVLNPEFYDPIISAISRMIRERS